MQMQLHPHGNHEPTHPPPSVDDEAPKRAHGSPTRGIRRMRSRAVPFLSPSQACQLPPPEHPSTAPHRSTLESLHHPRAARAQEVYALRWVTSSTVSLPCDRRTRTHPITVRLCAHCPQLTTRLRNARTGIGREVSDERAAALCRFKCQVERIDDTKAHGTLRTQQRRYADHELRAYKESNHQHTRLRYHIAPHLALVQCRFVAQDVATTNRHTRLTTPRRSATRACNRIALSRIWIPAASIPV